MLKYANFVEMNQMVSDLICAFIVCVALYQSMLIFVYLQMTSCSM